VTRTVTTLSSIYSDRTGVQKTYARCPAGWVAVGGTAKITSKASHGTADLTSSHVNADDPGQWVAEWTVAPDPSGSRTVRTTVSCEKD
jgi:hypothetical protein